MKQKFVVKLTKAERLELSELRSSAKASAGQIRRACILLQSDNSEEGPNWTYKAICEAFNVSSLTVYTVRKRYFEGGLKLALPRKKPDRVYQRRLDREAEALLIAVARSEPPNGYRRWSLRLLKDRIIHLGIVDNISHETIRQTLKKSNLNLV
ncbi:MAG: helix-turn-helix domain-containing protein [Chloroflexota bacterium]